MISNIDMFNQLDEFSEDTNIVEESNIDNNFKYDLNDPNLLVRLKEDFGDVLSHEEIEEIVNSVFNEPYMNNNSVVRRRNK